MKKAILYSIMLLIGSASCKKETSIESNDNASGNFTATIDGAKWAASPTRQAASILGGIITITGVSADNREINLSIADSIAGTYSLSQTSASLAAYGDLDSSNVYAFSTNQGSDTGQAGGTVTVTEIDSVDRTISGTFSFKAWRDIDGRQKKITNGVFARIPYVTALPPTSAKDTLVASIDGKAFTAINIQAATTSGQMTIIGATSDGTQSIGLLLPANASPGTYNLGAANPSYLGAYTLISGSSSTGFVSSAGSVTITSNNTGASRIKGSFQFTAVDPTGSTTTTHAIASGVFSVYYGQ
ncbi:MAG TPA: DUF6252 family protein [Puia sp.]|uniref:DUF6252 family protein n=1 Tax=Puia sp. TaxID=2045100 RepID=UPI002CF1E8DD|nr:DUF6252 family protein [Puia sp.]HVU98816.1 DUF6252 family protein [Puia sp.]